MLCNCFVFNEGGLHWTLRKSAQCCVFLTWVLLCSRLLTHLLPLLLDTVSSSTIWCKALTSPAVIYKSEQTVNSILLVSFIRIRGHLWMHVLVFFFFFLSLSVSITLVFPRRTARWHAQCSLTDFCFVFIECWDILGLSGGFMSAVNDECTIYLDLWKYWCREKKNPNIYFISCRVLFCSNVLRFSFNQF